MDLIKWYNQLKKYKLTPDQAIYLIICYKGQKEKEKMDSDFMFNEEFMEKSLLKLGYLDDLGMLTKKFFTLPFIEKVNRDQDLAMKMRDIFPIIIIPTSGKLARASLSEMIGKLKWFRSTFNYSEEVILEACKEYVSFFENKRYEFMSTSASFIWKEDKTKARASLLADWCQIVTEKGETTESKFGIDV